MNSSNPNTVIKIGGACGFWGDSALGTAQLLQVPGIQYITFDYLAELTLAIMAGMRMKNPDHGYALDFVELMKRTLPTAKAKGIKLIANAGGLNPNACAKALQQLAEELQLDLKIGVVQGDDVQATLAADRAQGQAITEPATGQAAPPFMLTANAYLGAFPIAAALDAGADLIITGRVVDSALVLGALIHEFRWTPHHLDELAQGSLAGHLVECGAQGSGGLFTDWEQVPNWANIGYPVVEVGADGSFVLTKPDNTGGLVNKAVATEQLLYEIGDPANYRLPDVVCDFTEVDMAEVGPHRVKVWGARGKAPSNQYKVCATYPEGFRCIGLLSVVGIDAAAKARRTAETILERTRQQFKQLGWADYIRTHIEVLEGQSTMGNEAFLRLAITHSDKKAASLFAKEIAPAGTSYAPGTGGNYGMGRPNVVPLVRLFSTLIDKSKVQARIQVNQVELAYAEPEHPSYDGQTCQPQPIQWPTQAAQLGIPLIELAHGRSGDKGNLSNVGLVARNPEAYALLTQGLTEAQLRSHLSTLWQGPLQVFALPKLKAINVLLHDALDGGGMSSMRNDALGKGMAQKVLQMVV